jgi:hypothetical protein
MSETDVRKLWALLLPEVEQPSVQQWNLWFCLHEPDVVKSGIAQMAAKYRRVAGSMDAEYRAKFASAVMNRLQRERTVPFAQKGTQQ